MNLAFAIIAVITIAASVAAMSLRNLVHCALALSVAFAGLAVVYLQLNAQFVGFAQLLVYVGAVAILIVFAILLTRGGAGAERSVFSSSWMTGAAVAAGVLLLLCWAISHSLITTHESERAVTSPPEAPVRLIGEALMSRYVVPLEVVGLLLTAALIGAVIIAMKDKEGRG